MITVNFPPNISSLTAPGLTQYDTGQIISMTGTGITTETVQVHFAASGQSGAIVKTGTVLGGVITAEIPDSVLAMGRTITAWAYVIDGDARETRYTAVLPVVNRARPQDYISPAEPPYVTAHELNDRIVTAETAVTELSDGLTDRYTKTETDGLLAGKVDLNDSLTLTNMITNGDFALPSVINWLGYASSISVLNNALEAIGSGVNYRNGADYSVNKSFNANDVVYARVKVKTSDSNTQSLRIEIMSSTISYVLASSQVNSPTSDVFYDLSALYKYTVAEETSRARLLLRSYYDDATTQNGKKLTIDNVLFINLTSTFGAGNEPTKEEMDKLIDMIGWFDGEITLAEKQLAIWTLNLIRQNRNAIIALGGIII